jgi:hypothetical protein
MAKGQRDWHRLFGLVLTGFFSGLPFTAELEKGPSPRKPLLGIVLYHHAGSYTERSLDGQANGPASGPRPLRLLRGGFISRVGPELLSRVCVAE